MKTLASMKTLAKAIALGPEAPLATIASGDFSALSYPLLIAASCQQQLEDFTWKEGLICTEVRRFIGGPNRYQHLPHSKILLLLPGWDECPHTTAMVEWWVNIQDRYTVQLDSPRSPKQRRERRTALVMASMVLLAAIITTLCITC